MNLHTILNTWVCSQNSGTQIFFPSFPSLTNTIDTWLYTDTCEEWRAGRGSLLRDHRAAFAC
jgi:hypothetical protein